MSETIMSWDEYFMRHVYLAASKSKDPRTKIGAILVKDGVVISEGFIGFARGVLDLPQRYNDKETKYQYVVHGEHNSILNAARRGVQTLGSVIYTQGVPCNECAKAIVQAGITKVVLHCEWPNMDSPKWEKATQISKTMFEEAGIPIEWFCKVLDLKGFIDGKEISV